MRTTNKTDIDITKVSERPEACDLGFLMPDMMSLILRQDTVCKSLLFNLKFMLDETITKTLNKNHNLKDKYYTDRP